jgi:hypothetical protein
MSLVEIHKEHHREYDELTTEQKEELTREFTDEKDGLKKVRRPTARGRLQDVLNVVRNMQQLVCFLFLFLVHTINGSPDDWSERPCWY